ncbi:MAG: hypothetical protein LBI79_10200 [Nitrososphaerota archaeon]|jgi:hypothetical protein|nr:hypothetical protein [Nitrososphaerota archaeon]
MSLSKGNVIKLIVLVVLIVLFVPLLYLREANNLFGALTYFAFYVAFALILQHVVRKSGFEFPKGRRGINTLTTEGRIWIMISSGFFFAAIIAIIIRELTGLPQPYFWVLFATLFVIGAIIGDTIRKASQKT